MRLTNLLAASQHFKLLIVGGGSGGLGTASKFAKCGSVGIIEPREKHFYQPGFTLVGGGLMSLEANVKNEADLIPKNTTWVRDKVKKFEPKENKVILRSGGEISYDYMVVAMGIDLRFDLIKGALEALETPGVCSNYHPKYAQKHFQEAMKFQKGTALFTFPNTPIKCAGAPQKACYITDSLLRQRGVRQNAKIIYATSLPRLFGIEKYLKSLEKIAKEKDIDVRTRWNLVEVKAKEKIAVFEMLDEPGKLEEVQYSLLHIGPPCSAPEALRNSELADEKTGFLDVNPKTLQSTKFENVFGVGDCMNTANAKTAAAVSSHLKTVGMNLKDAMEGRSCFSAEYDGYASCPLVVSTNRVILAEFNPQGACETFPFDQSKPTYIAYLMKRYFMPFLYWNGLIKGLWNGPATIRKCFSCVKKS
ncbi:unnamed protein product [Caenorhabditis angaria]|uniref:Sulfide:quinone oxidoreductase, mitochondrial n=1 Tax=Caenorhabditis angaria TaxID=860376 RepID=A0A9P1ISQ4_9PELO|nr:unnamed protein product [Caenorhabditis angaria]